MPNRNASGFLDDDPDATQICAIPVRASLDYDDVTELVEMSPALRAAATRGDDTPIPKFHQNQTSPFDDEEETRAEPHQPGSAPASRDEDTTPPLLTSAVEGFPFDDDDTRYSTHEDLARRPLPAATGFDLSPDITQVLRGPRLEEWRAQEHASSERQAPASDLTSAADSELFVIPDNFAAAEASTARGRTSRILAYGVLVPVLLTATLLLMFPQSIDMIKQRLHPIAPALRVSSVAAPAATEAVSRLPKATAQEEAQLAHKGAVEFTNGRRAQALILYEELAERAVDGTVYATMIEALSAGEAGH